VKLISNKLSNFCQNIFHILTPLVEVLLCSQKNRNRRNSKTTPVSLVATPQHRLYSWKQWFFHSENHAGWVTYRRVYVLNQSLDELRVLSIGLRTHYEIDFRHAGYNRPEHNTGKCFSLLTCIARYMAGPYMMHPSDNHTPLGLSSLSNIMPVCLLLIMSPAQLNICSVCRKPDCFVSAGVCKS